MTGELRIQPQDHLTAVSRTAQYLAMLRSDADLWPELGRVVMQFFDADLMALLERRDGGELVSLHASVAEEAGGTASLLQQAARTVHQVMDSGFLAVERITLDEGYAVAVLPLSWDSRTRTALLVGHRTSEPLPESLLNVYLGLAGLFENTISRLAEQRRAEERQRAALQYARSLIEASLDPLVTISAEGKITDVNAATEQVTGASRHELIGTDFSDYFTDPEQARAGHQQVFKEGLVRDYPLAIRQREGAVTDVLYNASLYHDEAGRVAGAFAAARDISERKKAEEALRRSEERLRLAMEASGSGIWDLDVRTRSVAASAGCQSMLGYQPIEVIDSLDVAWAARIHPDDRAASLAALEDVIAGRSVLYERDHRLLHKDGKWIWAHGKGRAVERDADGGPRRLLITETNITARKKAEEAAIENARLFEEQRYIATALQENYMHAPPSIASLDVAVVALTAHRPELVGGDFNDLFRLRDGRICVIIGDVQGKGIRAAGLTETVRSAARALAHVCAVPSWILTHLNEVLIDSSADQFVTLLVALIDTQHERITVASAGHPPPLLVGRTGSMFLEPSYGPPLGTFAHCYEQVTHLCTRGDSLVFYTDGLSEARRGAEQFGEERLMEAVAGARGSSAAQIVAELRRRAESFADGLRDDLQIVALKLLASGRQDRCFRTHLPLDASRLADLRQDVRGFLRRQALSEMDTQDVLLCLQEACTNAVRFGDSRHGMDVEVSLSDDSLVAIVRDYGAGFDVPHPSPTPPDPFTPNGRGLLLIHSLMDHVEITCPGGAEVRMLKSMS
jgi:PAS domain S-box-containing protein